MQEPRPKPNRALLDFLAAGAKRAPRVPTTDEPSEVLAERGKRLLLEHGVKALSQLTDASTIQDRAAAGALMGNALKVNGMDGAPKAGPGDQPTFLIEYVDHPTADHLALSTSTGPAQREADVVSIMGSSSADEKPGRRSGAA